MTTRLDSWQLRLKYELKKFIEGWDWERIYYSWKQQIQGFGVSLDPLFKQLDVYDPKYKIERQNMITWCPVEKIPDFHLRLQRSYDMFPGTDGPVGDYIYRKGELVTLRYLWNFKEKPQKVAAILIAASLFYRLGSSRNIYPKTWPSYFNVSHIAEVALAQFGEVRFPWHISCTEVLPISSPEWEYTLTDISGVVRFLAEEHAKVFLKYQPIEICFRSEPDPYVAKQLQLEYEEKEKKRIVYEQERQIEYEAENARIDKLKQNHPRYGEWGSVKRDELESLVWSMPTVQVANLFGISDSAVGKRCRTLNVTKPPRGFWAKVQAGVLPHPEGKLQTTNK